MHQSIEIAGHKIGPEHSPYVIAELSGNHNGDLDRALRLIELASQQGASAIKMQTYTADTLTIRSDREDFKVKGGLWDGQTLYQLYQWAHTPWDWHKAMFDKARSLGITIFSTPFDETAVDFLESLDAPAYKIASFEMTDLPLVKKVAETGKPVIMSTGMATFDEIDESVATFCATGNRDLVLLHCVSSYPAQPKEANLKTISALRERYGAVVGLSDHTLSNATAVAGIALGASVVEKHFIDSRSSEGPDSAFSIEPEELRRLCLDCLTAWEAIGQVKKGRTLGEKASMTFRRSVYAVDDVKKGEIFSNANLRRIRPGFGVAPKYLEALLGQKAPRDYVRGEPVKESDLKLLGIHEK